MNFGPLLQSCIETHGSVAAFAKRLGVTPPYVFQIIKGDTNIPVSKVEKWADALKLTGKEREQFLEAAYLTHCPPYIQDLVRKFRTGG